MMVSSRLAGFICGFDLKKGGDAPQAKSLSAPIQIVLCAFDCFALFVVNHEKPFQPSPIETKLGRAASASAHGCGLSGFSHIKLSSTTARRRLAAIGLDQSESVTKQKIARDCSIWRVFQSTGVRQKICLISSDSRFMRGDVAENYASDNKDDPPPQASAIFLKRFLRQTNR